MIYLFTKLTEALGIYSLCALIYVRLLALSRGITIKTVDTAHGKTLEFRNQRGECVIISRRHLMYGPDIIRFFDYYHEAVVPRQRNEASVADYSQPDWHVLKKSGIRLHFTSLPESDITTEIYLEKAAPQPGHVIFDLGGYCGGSSYFFSKAGGSSCRIFTLEPDRLNYDSLRKNVEFHQLENVTTLPLAIWSHAGKLQFQNEGNMGSGLNEIHNRKGSSVEISSLTLEDLMARYQLDRIDFIKMDIEGAGKPLFSGRPLLF